ncbi:hypothetical protein [Pusillimonas noertemannii]|uniref:hypothetical protein n=1 Tax=Pusillimonas noertemannii TaxID=305977 RepID=UPI0002FBCED7|nr:hypothetical protein [Pusillimonas noertemannii]
MSSDSVSFLLYSSDAALAERLAATLAPLGRLAVESQPAGARAADADPGLVLVDFTQSDTDARLKQACGQTQTVLQRYPGAPCLAIGRLSLPGAAIAAFRAGARDFIDPDQEEDFMAAIRRHLLSGQAAATRQSSRTGVLLLGVRPGIGTSTLAVHLASLMQRQLAGAASRRSHTRQAQDAGALPLRDRVCLLDLGVPAGDGLLYLNMRGDFHFVDAVQSLRRLDETLLSSALPQTPAGLSVLALPRELDHLQGVSHADSLALFELLREHFGLLVADAGGLSNPAFIAGMARTTDHVWVIADQSVGALVSLADMLAELERHEVDKSRIRLVLSRYDLRHGMAAAQIADRFDIALGGVLPERSVTLRRAMNVGKLLLDDGGRDPYLSALQSLARGLLSESAASRARPRWNLSHWLRLLRSGGRREQGR